MFAPEEISPIGLRHIVAKVLTEGIIAGDFRHGIPLSPHDIRKYVRKKLGRRKTSPQMAIREGLAIMEGKRLVQILPKQGTFLRFPSDSEIAEIQGARLLIEQSVARKLSETPNPDLMPLFRINEEMKEISEAPDRDEHLLKFVELDDEFHRSLAVVAGYPTTIADTLSDLRSRLRLVVLPNAKSFGGDTVSEHNAILKAIENAKPSDAERAVAMHLSNAMRRWKSRLGPQDEGLQD